MKKTSLLELSYINSYKFSCAVIAAKYQGKWVFVRQKGKKTWELPGGTHESNESIMETAKRELFEETGAKYFSIAPIWISSVNLDNRHSFGLLFYAEIEELGELPDLEIEEVKLFDCLPQELTYPLIHNVLFEGAIEFEKKYKGI